MAIKKLAILMSYRNKIQNIVFGCVAMLNLVKFLEELEFSEYNKYIIVLKYYCVF